MSKLETNQVDPSTGTTLTLGTSGDTIAIPSGVTIANSGTATGLGETNTPAFAVKLSGDQTISSDTVTKITFDSEIYDTDNAFASNKFTVPSGKAGKYFINLQSKLHVTTDYRGVASYIYKNGSSIEQIRMRAMYNSTLFNDGETQFAATGVLDLSEGDYIEGYGYIFSPNGGTLKILADCTMTGFKLI